MKTAAVQNIRQLKQESFNQDCLDLFKDLSVESLIRRILYIAATWTNSCYSICGLTSARRSHFSTYQMYGFTPAEIRRERLMRDRGYSTERVDEIMAKQPADEAYAELSDWVLKNDGTPEDLKRKIDERLEGKVNRN